MEDVSDSTVADGIVARLRYLWARVFSRGGIAAAMVGRGRAGAMCLPGRCNGAAEYWSVGEGRIFGTPGETYFVGVQGVNDIVY
jgi:hypothetical protein